MRALEERLSAKSLAGTDSCPCLEHSGDGQRPWDPLKEVGQDSVFSSMANQWQTSGKPMANPVANPSEIYFSYVYIYIYSPFNQIRTQFINLFSNNLLKQSNLVDYVLKIYIRRVCHWVCHWFATGLPLVCHWGKYTVLANFLEGIPWPLAVP